MSKHEIEERLESLNSKLQYKTFLEDEAHPSSEDFKVFDELRNIEFNKEKLPNLYRWKKAIEKLKRDGKN